MKTEMESIPEPVARPWEPSTGDIVFEEGQLNTTLLKRPMWVTSVASRQVAAREYLCKVAARVREDQAAHLLASAGAFDVQVDSADPLDGLLDD